MKPETLNQCIEALQANPTTHPDRPRMLEFCRELRCCRKVKGRQHLGTIYPQQYKRILNILK